MLGRIYSVTVFRYYFGLHDLFSYLPSSQAKEKGFLHPKILSGQVANINCWGRDGKAWGLFVGLLYPPARKKSSR